MHNFRKALLAIISFLLVIIIISYAIIGMYFNSEMDYFQDINVRNQLAGSVDFLVVGESRGLNGFDSRILDEKLGVCSYNLCGSAMSPTGKIAILKDEIYRNPVKTVVITVGFDDLSFEALNGQEGEMNLLPRLRNTSDRIHYLFNNEEFDNYLYLYGYYLHQGSLLLVDKILNKEKSSVNYEFKGYSPGDSIDVSLDLNEANEIKQSKNISMKYNDESIEKLYELIDICKKEKCEVILVTVPVCESDIWTYKGYQQANDRFKEIAEETGSLFFDFNLLKSRTSKFSDKDSFRNEQHLSAKGAEVFTKEFTTVISKEASGVDVSNLFYNSYDEFLEHSSYLVK